MWKTTKTVLLAASLTLNIIAAIGIKAIHSGEYQITRVLQAKPVELSYNNNNDDITTLLEQDYKRNKKLAAR